MKLTIKYFGQIAEITHCDEETLEFSQSTIGELQSELFHKYPKLKEQDFQIAHAMEIAQSEAEITHNEIALLPPFSGG